MACRTALVTVLPSVCSAIWYKPYASADGVSESMESALRPTVEADCQVAKEGSLCYTSIQWLLSSGFNENPTWYPGYSSESSPEEVQDMLYGLEKASCPRPCFAKVAPPSEDDATAASMPKFDCRDTTEGDLCYSSIAWLREAGFQLYPDWYPSLSVSSSTSAIQAELHRKGKSDCAWPCALEEERQQAKMEAGAVKDSSKYAVQKDASRPDKETEILSSTTQPEEDTLVDHDCRDAQPNTQCYNDVAYALAEGIRLHEALYEGLTQASHFKQIQEHLYLNNRSGCTRPCPEQQLDIRELVDLPEGLRELKRVEDMNFKELTAYLNGDWDGYVAKQFHPKMEITSTFEKRLYDPVTTTILEESLPLPMIDTNLQRDGSRGALEANSDSSSDQMAAEAVTSTTGPLLEEVTSTAPDTALEVSEDGFLVEKVVPTTDAARRVMECLRNLSRQLNPDNFAYLRAECEDVMARELPSTGGQRGALQTESMRYFVWALRHVEEMKTKWTTVVDQDQKLVPASQAAYEVMACLQKLSKGSVTEATFPLLVGECTDIMTKHMPNTGEQHDALYKEAMTKFREAQSYVDELKAKANVHENETEQGDVVDADVQKVVKAVVTDDPMPMIDADGQNLSNDMPMIDGGNKSAIEAMPMLDNGGKTLDSEPMPMLHDDGLNLETQAAPTVATSHESEKQASESPEEVAQRIQKQALEEAAAQTTTAAAHRETEAEMRERIKAEVVRELQEQIRAQIMQQRSKEEAPAEASHGQ
ncbi:unnamed protein product [Prorocentrum cordatum]|uniref:Uncharacterized protein n=1 Tax=Prorocentrum cordatum TaxID=2364126 RepID=A0ABN9UAM0_9DINO|nr:unnamed protein product [Polarella glacialis]|mmetsp:Transcript_11896/g.33338  ORF Transcript_11896/g.33338 Transcript_11896/m.33338 type:complete len:761 (-) Transcript_11896:140-2422(-)